MLLSKCSFFTSLGDLNHWSAISLLSVLLNGVRSICFCSVAKMARSTSESGVASAFATDPNKTALAPVSVACSSYESLFNRCFQ